MGQALGIVHVASIFSKVCLLHHLISYAHPVHKNAFQFPFCRGVTHIQIGLGRAASISSMRVSCIAGCTELGTFRPSCETWTATEG